MYMDTDEDPWLARRRLRAILRELREARGLIQQEPAAALDWSLSKVVRIEAGTVGVSTTDLLALLRLYGVDDQVEITRLTELARAARRRPWYSRLQHVLSPAYERYLNAEGTASVIMAFHPLTIPGLLQIEDYARAVIKASGAADIDDRLELRLKRQERLSRRGRPLLRYVLDEAALHRVVGGDAVMREQLIRLREAMTQPGISVQIIPFAAGAHAAMTGDFSILEFGGEVDDLLYIEGEAGSTTERDNRAAVTEYRERFGRLSSDTMPTGQAIRLIDALITGLRDSAQTEEPR
jgi:transcriptional regulator with XRE-family HTH domain